MPHENVRNQAILARKKKTNGHLLIGRRWFMNKKNLLLVWPNIVDKVFSILYLFKTFVALINYGYWEARIWVGDEASVKKNTPLGLFLRSHRDAFLIPKFPNPELKIISRYLNERIEPRNTYRGYLFKTPPTTIGWGA